MGRRDGHRLDLGSREVFLDAAKRDKALEHRDERLRESVKRKSELCKDGDGAEVHKDG